MAQQSFLFGQVKEAKQKNKDIISKAKNPTKAQKPRKTTDKKTGLDRNIAARIQSIRELEKQVFEKDLTEYKLILDKKELDKYGKQIVKNNLFAYDTETSGLDCIDDYIVGICVYTEGLDPAYIPFGHVSHVDNQLLNGQLSKQVVEKFLKQVAGTPAIMHHSKFDYRQTRNTFGIEMNIYWDTFIAAKVLNENEDNHKLKSLWDKYCSDGELKSLNYDEIFEKMSFKYVPIEVARRYAAKDAKMTWELYKFQEQFLGDKAEEKYTGLKKAFWDIEMEMPVVLADVEDYGVFIDKEFASKLAVEYNEKLVLVQDKIHVELEKYEPLFSQLPVEKRSKIGTPMNVGSSTQLAILIYDVLKLPSVEGQPPRGAGEDVLEFYEDDYPLFEYILEYRMLTKALSTYVEKLPREVKEKTGKLHGSFHQYGARTSRMSSTDPNLQNIPSKNKEIRKMFIAGEGWVFIGGDYSQQEPRTLAHISQDKAMLKAYRQGKDIYAFMGSIVYKLPYEDCLEFRDGVENPAGKKRRDAMKNIILGIMYGRGIKSIAKKLKITQNEATNLRDSFFKEFPGVRQYTEELETFAIENGYVETLYGYKRRLPNIRLPLFEITRVDGKEIPGNVYNNYYSALRNATWKGKKKLIGDMEKQGYTVKDNGGLISKARRQLVNSVIQGSSAGMTKAAMILIHQDKKLKDLNFHLILQVHDEIIGTCPKEVARKCSDRMKELMIKAATERLSIPMNVDTYCVEKWYGEQLEI